MASTQHRTPSEWAQLQTGQGLAYRFLGRCFYEAPDAEWIATLAEERLFEAWPFPSKDEDTTEGLSLLRDFCESWDTTKLGELQWDFTRLFVGPGKMLVPPWESVHRSKTGLTFQESTLRVREIYQGFGVEAPAIHREPDDHIGIELAFVGRLSELAAAAATEGDTAALDRHLEAQKAFLRDHLLVWAPRCLELVGEHAETAYYHGVARLTLGTLSESATLCEARADPADEGQPGLARSSDVRQDGEEHVP